MKIKFFLLIVFASIQTSYAQVIEKDKETIIDSLTILQAQEKEKNELAKQNAAKIKEQKKQEKALKDAEKAKKKAEKARKKAEKELKQKEKKPNKEQKP